MACPSPAPACGAAGSGNSDMGLIGIVLGVVFGGGIGGIIALANALPKVVPTIAGIVTTIVQTFFPGLAIGLSAVALASIGVSAALSAIATIGVVILMAVNRCSIPFGFKVCSSGAIANIVPACSSATDQIFPFSAMYSRVDMVINCKYWPQLNLGGVTNVFCDGPGTGGCAPSSPGGAPPDVPELLCFYHSSDVCAAGVGSSIGAGVGGILGAVGGAALGAAAAAAIAAATGCVIATLGLCAIAIIALACLIAAAVAVVAALTGAFAGGQIAKAVAESGSSGAVTQTLNVGDYITVQGNLAKQGLWNNANVMWFVGFIPNSFTGQVEDHTGDNFIVPCTGGTCQHGPLSAFGFSAPFCFTDLNDPRLPNDPCPSD